MSSVQLSTSWYYWVDNLANGLADDTITVLEIIPADYQLIISGVVAVPLTMIVILQWLDRTHKVIQLIIQVLNYTIGSTDASRDAVPSPTWMRNTSHEWTFFGKEKSGGPFTVKKVEDVKTVLVLRLIPLIVCLSVSVNNTAPTSLLKYDKHC